MRYHVYSDARYIDGEVAAGQTLTVYTDSGAGTAATLYTTQTGAVEAANPYTVPATGIVDFWLANPLPYALAEDDTEARPLPVTVAPSGAVNVVDYGAKGDGTTDDTAAVQAAALAAAGMTLAIPQGTFIISDTIDVETGTLIVGHGGVLKLSDSPATANDFDHTCRVFDVQDESDVRLQDVIFREPDSAAAYSAIAFGAGAIRLHDSSACEVSGCRFEFDGFATGQPNYMHAAWVEGPSSDDNRIVNNYCLGAAIEYAYDGASRTTVRGNSVINSAYNGITGHADATISANSSSDNRIVDNTIVGPARMGIEDWGDQMVRTLIRGNSVYDTGVSLADGFGISADGSGSTVEGNTITDFDTYGIEVSGSNVRVIGNAVSQVAAGHVTLGTGIILDLADPDAVTIISGNIVTGVDLGIQLYAGFGDAIVTSNRVIDPTADGIKCDPNSAETQSILIEGNSLALTAPNTVGRTMLTLAASAGAGDADYRVIGNSIVYDGATAGGSAEELAVLCTADNATIIGNFIDGGGMDFGGTPPEIRTDGATPANVTLIGNTLVGGARIRSTYMVTPTLFANGVAATGWGDFLGFFGAAAIQKPAVTGDRSDGTALTNLLTQLATLGLITDSTTA